MTNIIELKYLEYLGIAHLKNKPFKGSGMNSMQNLRIQVNGMDSIWYYNHPEVRNYYGCNSTLDGFNKKDLLDNYLDLV